MSWFTEFNGPQQGNPFAGLNTSKLLEFINEYNKLSQTLQEHISNSVNDTEAGSSDAEHYVHGVKTALDSINSTISNIEAALATKADTSALAAKADTSTINTALNGKADKTDLDDYATNASVNEELAEKVDTSTFEALQNDFTDLLNAYGNLVTVLGYDPSHGTIDQIRILSANIINLTATSATITHLKVEDYIDMTKMTLVKPRYAGTGASDTSTNGLYVIGRLSNDFVEASGANTLLNANKSKAAIAFIKSADPACDFNAIVEITATKKADDTGYTGTIMAHVSKQPDVLKNLSFELVWGTYAGNQNAVYLCLSASDLWDRGGHYTNLQLYVSGINFKPLASTDENLQTVKTGVAVTGTVPEDAQSAIIMSNLVTEQVAVDYVASDVYKDASGKEIIRVIRTVDPESGETIDKRILIGTTATEQETPYSLELTNRPSIVIDDVKQYFITDVDVAAMQAASIGTIQQWPIATKQQIGDNTHKVPVDVVLYPVTNEYVTKYMEFTEAFMCADINPELGFLPLNGATLNTADYPDLARAFGKSSDTTFTLPYMDYGIIKYKNVLPGGDWSTDQTIDLETLYNLISAHYHKYPIEENQGN